MSQPGQPIDTAYVEILPDFSGFVSAVRRELSTAMRQFERQAEAVFDDIEDAAEDAGRAIYIFIRIGAERAERAIDDLADSGTRDLDRITRSAHEAGRAIAGVVAGGAAAGALGVFNQIANAVGSIASAASSLGFVGLILAALPAVIALAAALADLIGLIGLLPAGLLVAVAAIAPLVIAFQNFGDAVSAISEGDPEKIAEALKKLAPAAQSVAKEFGLLIPQFQALQRSVQQEFFAPLQGAFTELGTKLLPTLSTGLGKVAHAFGIIGENVLGILGLPENVALINQLFTTTARIIGNLGPNLDNFIGGFLRTAEAGLPVVETLFNKVSNAVGNFGEFLEEKSGTGELQAFIDDALATLGELLDLGKALGALFGTIFDATDDSGRSFLQTLTDLVNEMNEFFESAEGQDALQDLTELVKLTGQVLGILVDILLDGINFFAALDDAAHDVEDTFGAFNQTLMNFGANARAAIEGLPAFFGQIFQQAIDAALQSIGIGVGAILFLLDPRNLANALTEFGPELVRLFDAALTIARQFLEARFQEIKDFIFGVPGEITSDVGPAFLEAGKNLIMSFMNGFRSANQFIGDVAGDIAGAVKGFLNRAIDKINEGIGKVDDVLPGSLPRIPRLAAGGIVGARPGGVLAQIAEGGKDEVVAPLDKLKDILGTGPSVTFGPGAISIVFEGVVPTEQQARTTGAAVGQAIIDLLAQRDQRMQVRAV